MSVIRLLDAAADRAVEGLRVIEDYTRFVLNDRFLTEKLKTFRHQLVELLSIVPFESRLNSRETQYDVGTSITLASEQRREDFATILRANFSRLQEALRSLEESAKCAFPTIASGLEQLRYQSYTLQKAVQNLAQKATAPRRQTLASVRWQDIETDDNICPHSNGPSTDWLFLSDDGASPTVPKPLSDREKYRLGILWKYRSQTANRKILVENRIDLAHAIEAHGVLLDQKSLPVFAARDVLNPGVLVGVRVRCETEAQQAILDAADFIVPSNSKYCPNLDYEPEVDIVHEPVWLTGLTIPIWIIRSNVKQ